MRTAWQNGEAWNAPPSGDADAARSATGGAGAIVGAPPLGTPGRRPNRALLRRACQVGDLGVALGVLGLVLLLMNLGHMPAGVGGFLAVRLSLKSVVLALLCLVWWRAAFLSCRLYDGRVLDRWARYPLQVLGASVLAVVPVVLVQISSRSQAFAPQGIGFFWFGTLLGLLLLRTALGTVSTHPAFQPERAVVVVGSGPRARRVLDLLAEDSEHRNRVVGFVESDLAAVPAAERRGVLGSIDQLESILMNQPVDEVLIALPMKSRYDDIERAIAECERAGIASSYLADAFDCALARPRLRGSDELPMVTLRTVADDWRVIVKRAFDLIGASVLLLGLAPLLLAAVLAVRCSGPGPIFFMQERYGYRKRRFRMYKLRTMVDGAERLQGTLETQNEARGPVFKIRDDPRITRVGRLLRRTSLDELPQLFNVLRGEMSLVGPRPLPVRDVSRFSEAWLMRRFSVVPGMTGLWQVSGRSNLNFEDWIALDLQYIDRWSLMLDLRILLKTVPAVVRGTGAS
ncbi:MAG TPA: sugar transferase [Gemmatimonadales bacterium]|nr:sugar transferase [Gemmatimonadales bacterium]